LLNIVGNYKRARRDMSEIVTTGRIESVLIKGDLSALSEEERVKYYLTVCESLGLNPMTKPFEYIRLNNKLTLYALKGATDQLRSVRGISISIVAREMLDAVGLYVVTARATTRDGRTDEAIGAVPIAGLKGEALANALMKAETKAKRRATLSLCGLGILDETETETIPNARPEPIAIPAGDKSPEPEYASPELQKRLWAAAQAARMGEPQMRQLLGRYGINTFKKIPLTLYPEIYEEVISLTVDEDEEVQDAAPVA
jgi:hypothetical protein